MKRLFCILLVLIGSTSALAKDARIPVLQETKIPKGTVALYELEDGSRFTTTFLGKTKLGYKSEWRDDASGKGRVFRTIYNDKNGRLIREVYKGLTILYAPHSCARVMGRCDYSTTLLASGETRYFQMQTRKLKNGDYEGVIFSGGTQKSRTRYKISKFYGLGASWIFEPEKGRTQKGRLIEVRRP